MREISPNGIRCRSPISQPQWHQNFKNSERTGLESWGILIPDGSVSDISEIEHSLPKITPRTRGKEEGGGGMGSLEAERRKVKRSGEGNWAWPENLLTVRKTKILIGIVLEI